MGFPALGNPSSTRLRAGMRTSLRKRLFRNLRMRLLPIRVMKISRRVAATVESVSSSTKAPTSIPNQRCAVVPLQPRPLVAWLSRRVSISQRLPSQAKPPRCANARRSHRSGVQSLLRSPAILGLLPPNLIVAPKPSLPPGTPNLPRRAMLSSTSRCSASSIEAETGGSCSSSIVRPAILPPSMHRSSCKLSILRFGRRRRIPPLYV